MALKLKMPVYFMHVRKVAPRHYEAEFKLVYDGVEPVAEHQITERYIALLEAMIRESPELWMWSHRRWKHKSPRITTCAIPAIRKRIISRKHDPSKIVILNWNGRDYLSALFPPSFRALPGAGIVVADNGSTDDSVRFLERRYPQVELLRLDRNYGYAEGYNRRSPAERRVFRTAQFRCRSDRGVARSVDPHARRRRSVAAVSPKIRSFGEPDKFEYAGCGRRVHRFSGLSFLSRPHTRFDRVRPRDSGHIST